jgi:hypothetical protein
MQRQEAAPAYLPEPAHAGSDDNCRMMLIEQKSSCSKLDLVRRPGRQTAPAGKLGALVEQVIDAHATASTRAPSSTPAPAQRKRKEP